MRIRVDASVATRAHEDAFALCEENHEPAFQRALERLIRRFARQGAARFEHRDALTAAGELPSWRIPLSNDLIDEAAAQAQLEEKAKAFHDRVATTTSHHVSAALGISFEQSNRLLHGVIASQSGMHISTAPADLVASMMQSLQESYDKGLSIPHAAREMRKTGYTHAKGYAERIARTELIGAVNGASLAQVQGATTIPYKLWMATNDNRTRPHHREADGQTVPISAAFNIGGSRLEYPGDPSGPGEEVILCRCTMGYVDEPRPGAGLATSPNVSTTSAMEDVQATAEDVIGQVVKVPIKLKELPDSDTATARSFPDGSIGVHSDNSMKTNLNAVTHEAGHLVDRSILGTEDEWFTQTEASQRLFRMMRDTPTMRAVRNDEITILKGDTQTRNYILQGREMFARAFHQHVAQVTKNPDLMAEIRHLQNDDYLSFQVWQDDEFAPISEALRGLFEAVTASAASSLPNDRGGSMAAVDTTTDTVIAGAAWSGVIAQEGIDTGDGRRIEAGALNWRELPLTMMAQHTTPDMGGHAEAAVAGRIDALERQGSNIVGGGVFDSGAWGAETERLVREGMLKGISIDLAINEAEIIPDPNAGDEIEALFLGTLNVLDGTILGATIVPFPAFENANIAIVAGAAMHLHDFRRENGRTLASFYMPFAPAPPAETPPVADDENDPGDAAADAAEAIADIKEVVDSWPGLNGQVVVTIDGQDTTLDFPPATADGSEPGEDNSGAAAVTPEVLAALARLQAAMNRSVA